MSSREFGARSNDGLRRFVRYRHAANSDGLVESEEPAEDWLAVEEPLEIRVSGERWLVTMRTPGHDRELVLGLLFAEGIITGRDDVAALSHCGRPGDEDFGNVIDVKPAPAASFDLEALEASGHRGVLNTACGVCGRKSVEDLLARCAPVTSGAIVGPDVVPRLAEALASRQKNFAHSGGVHAAMLATPSGESLSLFEDVGRHNAVDKVLGHHLLKSGLPAEGLVLVVSGRVSFEIVQKAVVSRCVAVIGISAPSSLAVETAQRFGIVLVGFLRARSFNVYSSLERLRRVDRTARV